jgi:hypothetical protein
MMTATTLNDESESATMFSKFANYKGSSNALLGSANAVALLFIKASSYGRGNLDSWKFGRTITTQLKGCALGYYTMGHELAHNFGSTHEREHASANILMVIEDTLNQGIELLWHTIKMATIQG